MNKIKVGIFIDNFFPNIDGVVMVVDNYAKVLSSYADVTVVAPSYGFLKNSDKKRPYKVIRVKSIKVPILSYNLATPAIDLNIDDALFKEEFDIIHIHSPFALGKLGVDIARIKNIPVVATMHSQFKKDFLRYVKSETIADMLTKNLMKVYNSCDECWAVNEKIAELFIEYGYNSKPLVMPNATDLEIVKDKMIASEIVNEKYNLKPNETVLLFVGRINIMKNVLFIAEVLYELKKKNINFKMLFVGSGKDTTLLKERLHELSLEENVILCGEVKDRELLKDIYSRSKLFIFPSLYDASSLVQIEAASQKTPTIFLEGAVTASTVKNDVNGFTAPNDAKKFASKIIRILKNKKLYDNVSEASYKDIYKNYDKTGKILYKRYIRLINSKRQK